ncbi:MAG: ABC transporter permease [Firmicutes bacterium]|nr:ABC transporter permease [Bacillota bacterium]
MNIFNTLKRFSLSAKLSVLFLILLVFMVTFLPNLEIFNYNKPTGKALESPSKAHILGTDDLGIDLFSQLIYGGRISLFVGLLTAIIAGIGGSLIGIISGYFEGYIDKIFMRLADIFLILPELPTMIVLGAFFGPSMKNIIFVLSIFTWTKTARIIRSKVLSIKEDKYIKMAKAYGGGFLYITFKHFLPKIFPIIMISFIKLINRAIIFEASLSFLGLGDPTSKSWGLILNYALNFEGIYFTPYWKWWLVSPLVSIILVVVSISLIVREFESIYKIKV